MSQQLLLFRNKSFTYYTISAFLSTVSNGLNYIALTWIVLNYQHGGVGAIVILMFCFWLPSVILGPFSGVIVDRLDRRKLFIFMSWSRGLLLVALGFIEWKYQSLLAIYIIAILEGCISTPVLPTVTALVREIIEKKHLLIANTTIDMVYETGNVIGMAIAGFSVALLSNAGAIMLAGALFFISTAFAYGINTPYRSTIAKAVKVKEVFNDLIMGLNYIVKRTEIKVVYTLQLLSLVIYMVVPVLTAPFAHKYLHANVTQFGYLEALLSIGVVVGNILAAPMVNRLGLLTTMIIYNALLAICFTLFALNRDLTTAYVLHLFIGIGFAAWALIMTRAQEITDIDFQGRVSASFNSLSSVVMLIVYGIMYFEGKVISLSHLYYVEVLSAVISLALIIYYYRFFISAKQID